MGCKVHKLTEVATSSRAKTEVNKDIKQTLDSSAINLNKVQTMDKTVTNESMFVSITDTYLSVPDSSGKQYPTRIVNTTVDNKKGTKADVKTNTDSKQKTDLNKKLVDKSDSESDNKAKAKNTGETETDNPAWVTWGIIVAIIIIGVIIFLVLKRYNIIK
jgi:cobalamin biosynthesis Mg chelatase CobN